MPRNGAWGDLTGGYRAGGGRVRLGQRAGRAGGGRGWASTEARAAGLAPRPLACLRHPPNDSRHRVPIQYTLGLDFYEHPLPFLVR